MSPDQLFVRRCEKVAVLAASSDPVDLVDLAGALAQLLCDKHSLVDSVNNNKIKLNFLVMADESPPQPLSNIPNLFLWIMEDGLDPQDGPPIGVVVSLSLDQFLAYEVMFVGGISLTIKDVIKYARSAAGGVHYDPTPQYGAWKALREGGGYISMQGAPVGLTQLRSIARVTLKALVPLIDDVKMRIAG